MLLQVDGSRHDWLEGRGPVLTLVGGIDDATGIFTGATFRLQEDAAGYFTVRPGGRRYSLPMRSPASTASSSGDPPGHRRWPSSSPQAERHQVQQPRRSRGGLDRRPAQAKVASSG
jgi:hypothetical protein